MASPQVISRDMLASAGGGDNKPAAAYTTGADGANGSHGGYSTEAEVAQDFANKESHGAVVHDFDPDATPEQKKAQAMRGARERLGPISDRFADRRHGGTEVATDLGGKNVTPTVSARDIGASSAEEHAQGGRAADGIDKQAAGQAAIPGGLPQEIAAAIPEWYKIGWRAQSQALLDSGGDLQLARQNDLLAEFLHESYFGGWYHNAAIIFFAVFASHYVTIFGGGWAWLLIILAICSTYYQTSIRRVRQRARDDITRELAKQRLFTDSESVDWMNNFLSRFWLAYEPLLSASIVSSVDQVLSYSAPAGVDSLRMTHFTLGTKAPRIDFIRTHPGTDTDVVVMDWRVSFSPNDTADMTTRQASDKVNPKIVLTIKFGKGKVALSKDIVVEDVAFAGTMRIRLKLMNSFPHVQTVDLSFLEKPLIDYVASPIGFDLNLIPGLENFINNQIHATLGPMLYDPNVFQIDLEQLLSSAPIDTAIGVLHITVYNARGLKAVKFGGGAPDPYISFGLGTRTGLARTKIKHSTNNPHWKESKFLLVNSLNDALSLDVIDYNDRRKDQAIGSAVFDLKSLNDDAEQEDLTAPVMLEGKQRGLVKVDLKFFPVMKPNKLADGTEEPLPESKTGIVRISLHQAKDLDSGRGSSECNPYARIYLKGQPIHKTPVFKRNHNPMWEGHTEFLVTSRADAVIGVKVIDSRGFASDPTIGFVNVTLNDILAANAKQQDWFPLSGCARGKVRMTASFRPVAMAGAVNSAGDFRPPIGVVRLWIKKATDLKNVESLTGGKSDPYCRVIRSGVIAARTLVHNNDLDPVFDEIVYAPVHSLNETLIIEVVDYQHNSRDRALGQTKLDIKSLASEGTDKKEQPFVSTGPLERTDNLILDGGKSMKGNITFEARFYPTVPLRGVAFAKTANPLDKVVPRGEDADDDNASIIELDVDDAATIDEDDELSRAMMMDRLTGKTATGRAEEDSDNYSTGNPTPAYTPAPGLDRTLQSSASYTSMRTAETSGSVTDGITLSREEVLRSQSGVLVFNIVSGNLAKKGARLEVAFDDAYWPNYSTDTARTAHQTWDEVGEVFIRELEYSRIILRLNEADKDSREELQADFRTSLPEFLEQCLDKPADFMLTNENGGNRSTVTISAKYVPVPIQLEMRETVNNTGVLRVDLLDGVGLKAADRNGKSDPYVAFYLNGQKVHESGVQKRTLNPKWNEKFEVLVPSRVGAKFTCKVMDWDRVGSSDRLGTGIIDVVEIEPFTAMTQTVPISDNGQASGSINVRLVFRPEFVARSRAATSTFVGTVAGGAVHGVGAVAGTGLHVVGKGGKLALGGAGMVAGGAGAVGKGVFSGVKHVIPGHSRKSTMDSVAAAEFDQAPGQVSAAQAQGRDEGLPRTVSESGSRIASGVNGRFETSPVGGAPDFGNLTLTVTDFADLAGEDKLYCILKHSGKTLDKVSSSRGTHGHDTFVLKTLPENMSVSLAVFAKKFGRDKELGTAELCVWDVIHPGTRTSAETTVPLSSGGSVSLSLSWTPVPGSPSLAKSATGGLVGNGSQTNLSPDSPASMKSKSRFSMHRNRPSAAP